MATRIVINDEDIVTTGQQVRFGLAHRRRTGDIVRVYDTFTLARFDLGDGTAAYRDICGVCRGTGFRPEFAGIFNGECFPCRGNGVSGRICAGTPLDLARVLRRRQNAQARRDKARQTARQARQDAHALWLAADPPLAAALAEVRDTAAADPRDKTFSPLLHDFACQAARSILSPAQCTLAHTMYQEGVQARDRKRAAADKRQWIGEQGQKVTFTGTLIYHTHAWANFHGHDVATTLYILVGDDGNRVKWWRSGYWSPQEKAMYTLTGTVKELESDAVYGRCTVLTRCRIQELEPAA